nr:RMD1 family protein [Thiocystis violacea]
MLGRYLDLRRLDQFEPLATNPLVVAVPEGGRAVLFRSGAVVFFEVDPAAESTFIRQLQPLVKDGMKRSEREDLRLVIDPGHTEGVERDRLVLMDTDLARLQVVADILGKSVLLAEQESRVARAFDRIEPLADRLQRHGRGVSNAGALIRHIGEALAIQRDMVGRGEIGDKPEVIWERPDLERLFLNLEAEYEIRERQLALERKLTLINDTAGTLLDLLRSKRSLRVEWYIVILIVVEIVLTLYELFFRAGGH